MEVVIDSVTTADAAPVAAPHRISNKPTKSTATVAFTPIDEGLLPTADTGTDADLLPDDVDLLPDAEADQPILAYRFTTNSVGPYLGTEVSHRGRVATDQMACSESLVCEDFESASGTQLTEQVTYAETGGPADGPLPVNVWVNFNGDWV